MILDMPSFGLGFAICAGIAYAWMNGRDYGIRLSRRIYRHGRSLDYVFFEDAERDPTVDTPKPQPAGVTPIASRLP